MSAEENIIYKKIADQIRLDILEGRLQPGSRLPSIRDLTRQWHCTPGTVQKAYLELARQGLVTSRAGKGTHVAGGIDPVMMQSQGTLRKATLVAPRGRIPVRGRARRRALTVPEIQQSSSWRWTAGARWHRRPARRPGRRCTSMAVTTWPSPGWPATRRRLPPARSCSSTSPAAWAG